jgi:hypothetical protein
MRDTTSLGPPQRDLLCSGMSGFFFGSLPWFAFALGWAVSPAWRTVLWTTSLGAMGTVCLLNASRCCRVHCYFTGPLFILGAVASLGYGLGLLPLGASGWKWICAVTVYWRHRAHLHSRTYSRSLSQKWIRPGLIPVAQFSYDI